jgi:hypothetical protein
VNSHAAEFDQSSDRVDGDAERFSRVCETQPAEEAHLDDLTFARIQRRQVVQCIVERNQVGPGSPPTIRPSCKVT